MKKPTIVTQFLPVGKQPRVGNIARSFLPIRLLPVPETCSLKRHFTHAAREVVGYIDRLASLEHERERFVYASVPDILEHCKRFNHGKPYARRTVNYVLAFLREQHIISEPLYRMQRVGNFERYQMGFV